MLETGIKLTINDLRKVIAFSDLSDEHLQWILDRSEGYSFEDGDCIMKTGEPVDWMFILIEGQTTFYLDVNGKQVYYFTFANDKTTGGVGGVLPYSRMKNSPGYNYAVGKVVGLRFNKKYFPELEQLNPDLIQRLIGYMTERARLFATTQLQHEKVNALGQLAAGIAHELNNPAAAINRISSELSKREKRNVELIGSLMNSGLKTEDLEKITSLVEAKELEQKHKTKLSTMQLMEREDELSDWMEQNDYKENRAAIETFAETGFTADEINAILEPAAKDARPHMINWMENMVSSKRLIKDLSDASCRISDLVGAIKSHVHMDQSMDMQPTRINKDLDNTLTLLGHKLRQKNITVHKNFQEDLPNVPAYVGELNQVWTNLIDNAIFALEQGGELTITTSVDKKKCEGHYQG